jgi:hypothetical protein
MKKRIIAALAVSILVVSAPAFARGKKGAPTQPGTYADWKGEIDSLEIVNSFRLSDYSSFIVVPLDTDDTPLPGKDDNTY